MFQSFPPLNIELIANSWASFFSFDLKFFPKKTDHNELKEIRNQGAKRLDCISSVFGFTRAENVAFSWKRF